jgi:RNA polymerase sigma factor (sigma-70 family)
MFDFRGVNSPMPSAHWSPVLRYLRRISAPTSSQIPDRVLLDRFVLTQDEEAFAALVKRHAGMVMAVCRRALIDVHSAEDAFQATFLVLVQKARAIAKPDCLGSWLYGVAYRTALQARSAAATRRRHEHRAATIQAVESNPEVMWRDLRPILDEEIHRLPSSYQEPIILCYFEGKTKEEAAQLLDLPVGTVSSRLARARAKLRSRLTRRGLTLSLGLLTCTLEQKVGASIICTPLVDTTIKAGLALAAVKSVTTGIVSLKAASLAEGVVKSMFLSKLKTAAAIFLGVTLLGSGVGVVSYRAAVAQEKNSEPVQEEKLRQEIARLKNELDRLERELERLKPERAYVEVAASREGIVTMIGTEIKEGENVPADQRISKQYRRLKVGDRVERGQLLGQIDDRLARDEMETKKNKVMVAKAELVVSEKTLAEAKERLKTQADLIKTRVASLEEYRGAQLAVDKYVGEVASKKAAIAVAKAELNQIETVVEMHNIRSPTRGIIKGILKHPGEGVRILETVFLIQPEE